MTVIRAMKTPMCSVFYAESPVCTCHAPTGHYCVAHVGTLSSYLFSLSVNSFAKE